MNKTIRTRRAFLRNGMALLAVTPTVPTFLDHTMSALAAAADGSLTQLPSGKDGKILVVVQLSGGNDGLNTVIPYADDAYHRARPQLRHDAKTVLRLDDHLGLHPNLAGLKKLYDQGLMSIVQGVGYPNPNRSHFRSMDIWHSAQPEKEVVTTGWLGRYFDNTCKGDDPHVGVSLSERLPLAMQGQRIQPLSFEKPETYRYMGADSQRFLELNKAKKAADEMAMQEQAGPAKITPQTQLDFLRRTAMDAQLSSSEILTMSRAHAPAATYPFGEFGAGLRTVAAMINGGLPTRVYYVSLGSFDTHAQERNTHDRLMQQLADGVAAFWADLVAQKNDDRVLMMTFSEFGRRVEQNASGGTDHGAAAPMMFFGKSLRAPGLLGKHPSLTDLDQGDLKFAIDFRNVYAAVLEKWLQTPTAPILGPGFDALPLVKG
jgi:uncharacterized protein (DUF1501 family)